jgi:hypothetical protein
MVTFAPINDAGLANFYSSDLQIDKAVPAEFVFHLRNSAGASQSYLCRRTVRPQLKKLVLLELAESSSLGELRCFCLAKELSIIPTLHCIFFVRKRSQARKADI